MTSLLDCGGKVEVVEPRKEEERQLKGRARHEQVEATGYFEVMQERGRTDALLSSIFLRCRWSSEENESIGKEDEQRSGAKRPNASVEANGRGIVRFATFFAVS